MSPCSQNTSSSTDTPPGTTSSVVLLLFPSPLVELIPSRFASTSALTLLLPTSSALFVDSVALSVESTGRSGVAMASFTLNTTTEHVIEVEREDGALLFNKTIRSTARLE